MIADIIQKKLTIEAYTDLDYKTELEDGKYEVMINPTSYTLNSMTEYYTTQTINSTGGEQKLKFITPKSLNLSFTLDGTGVTGRGPDVDGAQNFLNNIPSNPLAGLLNGTVTKSVEKFFRVCQLMDPKTHDTPYLKISWGHLIFYCRLKSANVTYELFTPGGEPLRAKIDASFCSHIDNIKRAAEEDKSSPDLTHLRVVKDGDTLPRMTEQIYGDQRYYLDVARINNLTNYRNLKPGTELLFPPIDQTATV